MQVYVLILLLYSRCTHQLPIVSVLNLWLDLWAFCKHASINTIHHWNWNCYEKLFRNFAHAHSSRQIKAKKKAYNQTKWRFISQLIQLTCIKHSETPKKKEKNGINFEKEEEKKRERLTQTKINYGNDFSYVIIK